MKTPLSSLLVALVLFGCTSPESIPPNSAAPGPADTETEASMPPEANRLTPNDLPTPFSADEIQAAATPGAFRKFRNQAPSGSRLQTMTFLQGDGSGAPVEGLVTDEAGNELNRVISAATSWEEFQGHASYTELGTTLTRGLVHVPAGSFDCWIYTTVDQTGADVETSFALDLPGPPVLVVTTRKGAPVMRIELVDYGPR